MIIVSFKLYSLLCLFKDYEKCDRVCHENTSCLYPLSVADLILFVIGGHHMPNSKQEFLYRDFIEEKYETCYALNLIEIMVYE